jgi:seryl-tRNA synthetase
MVDIKRIRTEKVALIAALKKRHPAVDPEIQINKLLATDDERKRLQTELDILLSKRNSLSKDIGALFKQGKQTEANQLKAQVQSLAEEIKDLEQRHNEAVDEMTEQLYNIPNIPDEMVPSGKGEQDNEVFKSWEGEMVKLPENAVPHWDLADRYRLIDFKLGAKITGSGFPLYRGKGAALQRALYTFFLDEAIEAGYEEVMPPLMVNEDSARATGQLPDKEGQMYHITVDDLYLIPTAEVPITNIYRDVVVDAADFPVKLTGFTPCFRREAGSYGSDVKGLNRVHQFEKVEIVQVQHPDRSMRSLDQMLKHVEGLLEKLELPYRILRLCGGDLGFSAAITYDFEVYAAAQQKWLEVSSVSNFGTFQSNRLNLKYRDTEGKLQLAHTLNGSALALARIYAALLENGQQSDGIHLPAVLHKYTGFGVIN